jgi:hypothetical protein
LANRQNWINDRSQDQPRAGRGASEERIVMDELLVALNPDLDAEG